MKLTDFIAAKVPFMSAQKKKSYNASCYSNKRKKSATTWTEPGPGRQKESCQENVKWHKKGKKRQPVKLETIE